MIGLNVFWRDVTLLLASALAAILLILLTHIHERAKEKADIESPGDLVITMTWDTEPQRDIDLWVRSPDGQKTGYSNKNTTTLSLLRDDLGSTNDILEDNIEYMFSRGLLAGQYTVNAHWYGPVASRPAPPVEVRVSVVYRRKNGTHVVIYEGKDFVNFVGHEVTLVNFTLDNSKSWEAYSNTKIQRKVR